ncbi:hypothetical protein AURDEDRAFT_172236 [Auricularia subglabra TFB-10046 SS5]|nr:hypothetical protein AURDEDRAFT_172236 [Auricularia subglabra TFB-10046 SS5]
MIAWPSSSIALPQGVSDRVVEVARQVVEAEVVVCPYRDIDEQHGLMLCV